MKSFYVCKALLFAGLASWLSMAAINNATDSGTNTFLLSNMMSMQGLIENPVLGNGLEWRAINSPMLASTMLYFIVIVQFSISGLLWLASWKHVKFVVSGNGEVQAVIIANYAIASFMCLWFFFLIGGLFFGYWMKFGGPQGVHFTLLIISILSMILNNMPTKDDFRNI